MTKLKNNFHNSFFRVLFFVYAFCLNIVSGQDANLKIYKAPNANFNDISLQTYNDLIRFGVLNDTDISEPKKSQSYFAYRDMIVFRQNQKDGWDSSFKNPENIDLFADNNSDPNGARARSMLTRLLPNNLSKKGAIKYFGTESPRRIVWGGRESSRFAKKRIFKSFVTENLDGLKNWSNEFLPSGNEEAYYVTLSRVVYDFENKGLLLSLDFLNLKNRNIMAVQSILDTHPLNYKRQYKNALSGARLTPESTGTVLGDVIYKPRTNYERIVTPEAFVVFHEITPEKANPILKADSVVYIVRKIKIYNDFTFHIVSPIIELYKDKGLTNKIGELDYNDLIFY